MGLLQNLVCGFVRGSNRMAEITGKLGPRGFNKGRGAKRVGYLTRFKKFVKVQEMVPEFVVPDLSGFKLRPYVSCRAPEGTEEQMTAMKLFMETAAADVEKDIVNGSFDPNNLEKYGFEPTQEGKLFKLYPRNYVQ